MSKYECYQVSFYVQELKILEKPEFYLTNQNEEHLIEEIYKVWKLDTQISMALSISSETIRLFSFLSNNSKDIRSQITSLLMSFLSFILMYESIGNLISFIFPESKTNTISSLIKLLMLVCVIVVVYMIVKLIIRHIKEIRELKKTRP